MDPFLSSFYFIRFSDCDPFRHLNNARYIDYMLNAREDHLRESYQMVLADFYKKGQGWVVVQHEIAYLRPASFNERVCILSGLLEANSEHLLVEILMLDEKQQQVKAVLHTRFIPVSLTTGKKQPHSDDFMAFISDKVLETSTPHVTLQDRVAWWQEKLKSLPTVKPFNQQ